MQKPDWGCDKCNATQMHCHFHRIGCTNPTKCGLAASVLRDLTYKILKKGETRVKSVKSFYDSELDLLYLRGVRAGVATLYMPVLKTKDLDLTYLSKVQDKLSPEDGKITLAICDMSSNVLYYQITRGFVEERP